MIRHKSGTQWLDDREIGWCHVWSASYRWRRWEARVSQFSLKTSGDDLTVIWPQNNYDSFLIWASKPRLMVWWNSNSNFDLNWACSKVNFPAQKKWIKILDDRVWKEEELLLFQLSQIRIRIWAVGAIIPLQVEFFFEFEFELKSTQCCRVLHKAKGLAVPPDLGARVAAHFAPP
jgi:hypothetical protein